MRIEPWKVLKSKILVQDRWLTLRADTCETADGIRIDPYYVFEKKDWAHVMAFDAADRVLIVRQYRHGSRTITAELPSGVIDETDVSPLEAAKRELLEETGCLADGYEALTPVYANPARQTNRVHCFLAWNARRVAAPRLDDTERIESEFVTLEALFGMIDDGRFSQALHIASVYQSLRRTGRLDIRRSPISAPENL